METYLHILIVIMYEQEMLGQNQCWKVTSAQVITNLMLGTLKICHLRLSRKIKKCSVSFVTRSGTNFPTWLWKIVFQSVKSLTLTGWGQLSSSFCDFRMVSANHLLCDIHRHIHTCRFILLPFFLPDEALVAGVLPICTQTACWARRSIIKVSDMHTWTSFPTRRALESSSPPDRCRCCGYIAVDHIGPALAPRIPWTVIWHPWRPVSPLPQIKGPQTRNIVWLSHWRRWGRGRVREWKVSAMVIAGGPGGCCPPMEPHGGEAQQNTL